jgi:hypothetical protein
MTQKERNTELKKMSGDEDVILDNSFDALPDVIDKDYGFFMMFGRPDIHKGSETTNYDSIVSVPIK